MSDDATLPKITGKQNMAMALFNGYCSLVRVLHRRGAISAGDVAVDIGNTLDFRRQRGIETADQHEMLEILYKAVLEIEQQETKLQEIRSQKGSAPE